MTKLLKPHHHHGIPSVSTPGFIQLHDFGEEHPGRKTNDFFDAKFEHQRDHWQMRFVSSEECTNQECVDNPANNVKLAGTDAVLDAVQSDASTEKS